MAGRPKRDYEVKSYLVRLPPVLIDRIEYCCSLLDVATRQRLPRNTRVQQALEQWCASVEAEAEHQRIPLTAPTIPLVPIPATDLPPAVEPLLSHPEPLEQPNENEALERILAAREQYDKLSLREFSQLLYDRDIYRSLDRKTRKPKPLDTGTLTRWLRQGGMT